MIDHKTLDEQLEAAFWEWDARANGDGAWRLVPQGRRDAFKAVVRNLLAQQAQGELTLEPDTPKFLVDAPKSALDVQPGGTHYKDFKIQPVEFIHANSLGFMEGNVVKYVARHRSKNKAADLHKAIHYCQLLLELEYGETQ